MPTNQVDEQSADSLNVKLTNIQLDIRELTTNFKNFNSNFERINTDMNEIKVTTSKALEISNEAKSELNIVKNKVEINEKDIIEVKTDIKDREKEQKADRKWLIGTVIAVLALVINNFKDLL